MDAVALAVFVNRVNAVCDQMGAVLRRAAFSPNIRDRLDFSCAIFDPDGALCAQAAHIPVHLGSMAYAMADIVETRDWAPGDIVLLNDPFRGGTHLPDVTVVMPVFHGNALAGFVANRAHHSDIGSQSPGSLPLSDRLEDEGVLIPPMLAGTGGRLDEERLAPVTRRMNQPELVAADFAAQVAANRAGIDQLTELVDAMGVSAWQQALAEVNAYAERLGRSALREIPDGRYEFTDTMDDDGFGAEDLAIKVAVECAGGDIRVDLAGTAGQVRGNINCPLSVTAAAVFYVFRCLMPSQTPGAAGAFRCIELQAPHGSLVHARSPAAVAAGNVETSSRIVDAVMGALARAVPERMAAASQGTMNNLAMGSRAGHRWDYYETLGGGMGASIRGPGLDAVHSHMTNTLNTPVEVVEMSWPLRIRRYGLRPESGGAGQHPGGRGVIREYEFLAPAEVSLISERRRHGPWGLNGGAAGLCGENRFNGRPLPGKTRLRAAPGDVLRLETPGGGGWGAQGGA